jgi:hypothetical protein
MPWNNSSESAIREKKAKNRIGRIIKDLYWTVNRREINHDLCGQ